MSAETRKTVGGKRQARCKRGLHPMTPENVYTSSDGNRRCLACKRDRAREKRQAEQDRPSRSRMTTVCGDCGRPKWRDIRPLCGACAYERRQTAAATASVHVALERFFAFAIRMECEPNYRREQMRAEFCALRDAALLAQDTCDGVGVRAVHKPPGVGLDGAPGSDALSQGG